MIHTACDICDNKQEQILSLQFLLGQVQRDLAEHLGQPRQADPSGAASLSTSQPEQPVNPAASPAYCTSGRLTCCCAVGHDGPHESFGGVQW